MTFNFHYRAIGLADLKRSLRRGICLFCGYKLPQKRKDAVCCKELLCRREYKAAYARDSRNDIFHSPTTKGKRLMAMTDEQEKAVKDDLEKARKELKEMQDAVKQTKSNDTEEARQKALKSEKPDTAKLDPDVVKEIAEQKTRIDELEKRLGGKKSSDTFSGMLDLFGGAKK